MVLPLLVVVVVVSTLNTHDRCPILQPGSQVPYLFIVRSEQKVPFSTTGNFFSLRTVSGVRTQESGDRR
jgi:hypothetical protein